MSHIGWKPVTKGLTGFVAQRQAVIGKALVFESQHDGEPEEIDLRDDEEREQLIIDGSAFCYRISRLHVDWTKGGESATLRRVLLSYIQGFRNAQLNPIFVWDGVFDTCKLDTVKSRIQASIRSSITYFRSSPSLRTNRGFRNESHLLPQLSIKACISHVRSIAEQLDCQIEQHFPGGEADFYIANLAIQRNAFIISLDSDFFITSHGSKGYIPLDSLQFVKKESISAGITSHDNDDGGDWGEVKSSRRKQRLITDKEASSTVGATELAISQSNQIHCKVYTATALASSLSLPYVSYLPLCAILAGNDYYSPPIWKASNLPSGSAHSSSTNGRATSQRFEIAASAILKQLRKLRKPLDKDRLPEFIRRVIDDIRDFAISDGQISDIAKAALATLPEYCVSSINSTWLRSSNNPARSGTDTPISISSLNLETESSSTVSPLHALLMPSTSTTQSRTASSEQASNIQTKLRIYNAFETGHFRNTLLQIIVFRTFTPSAVLEDPDKTSSLISLGRPLRTWIYAILNDSVGIGRLTAETGQAETREEDSALRNVDDDASSASSSSEEGVQTNSETVVTEYVRRNMSLAEEHLIVPEWATIDPLELPAPTPPLGRSTLERFHILLHATSSYTDRLRDTNGSHLPILGLIVAVRHIAMTFEGTAQAWPSTDHKAALAMALICQRAYEGHSGAQEILDKPFDPSIPIPNEHMQRAAQVTTTLLSVAQLVEVLLLTPLLKVPAEILYQGSLFFDLLEKASTSEGDVAELLQQVGIEEGESASLFDMMEEGLPQVVSQAKGTSKKEKKQKKAAERATPISFGETGKVGETTPSQQRNATCNKFAMLQLTD